MNINKHNNYKENNAASRMSLRGDKRGQIAIFVIVAIVILAIILVIFLRPKLNFTQQETFTPENYLKSCIDDNLNENINILARQGGYFDPEGFIVYNSTKVKYLCYSSQYYTTCTIQQPKLVEHFQNELNALIKPKVQECARSLKSEYERQGYSVSLGNPDSGVALVPNNIVIQVSAPITLSKGDSVQNFKSFNVKINSQMYDLLITATSVIDYEATYGDSETTLYMQYYPDLRIDKTKLSDGSTIYKLSNVVSHEEFTFASRSLAWPPGYGLE